MPLSKNQIKYLSSLKIKKYRDLNGQFIVEGERIIRDMLQDRVIIPHQLIATAEWLSQNRSVTSLEISEIIETDQQGISRISSLETPPPVLAVMNMPEVQPVRPDTSVWSLALDGIQDPGNMGTIIRSADWFGVRHIFCSADCADCYNPKVVQASMGALFHVKIHYGSLREILDSLPDDPAYRIYGTFMKGTPVYEIPAASRGMILFGNEARGISAEIVRFIHSPVTIPPVNRKNAQIESLNVASAVAVVCAVLIRN